MFSVLNPNPHEMTSSLHPTYHYEDTGESADRLRALKVSEPRVNKQYTAQSASPTLSHNSPEPNVKRTKAKLPGHLLIKSYKRLKGR